MSKKNQEMKSLTDEDLANELNETQVNYAKLKYDHGIQGIENPLVIREMRRDIARLKTEQRRREVDQFSADDLAKRSRIMDRRRNN